jgi:cobalt/nickel transport system permease protein
MGANMFNMGVVGTLGGYALYRVLARLLGGEARGRLPAAAIAAWASVVGGSLAMALELAISGTTSLAIAGPTMGGLHVLIGIGEALVTVAAIGFVQVTRSDLLTLRDSSGARSAGAAGTTAGTAPVA